MLPKISSLVICLLTMTLLLHSQDQTPTAPSSPAIPSAGDEPSAYILGPVPAQRGVPPELVPAIGELRERYTTHRSAMDPGLTRRLGLFDYLRRRLAVAGTPDDCVSQVRAALEAGAGNLMFTVSLASDPERTVELFGREVLPAVRRWHNADRKES